jgi:hypothetical protein
MNPLVAQRGERKIRNQNSAPMIQKKVEEQSMMRRLLAGSPETTIFPMGENGYFADG